MSTDKLERPHAVGPGFAQSFRELSLAQKGKKGVPLYCLYVNRPAGRVVAAALRNTRFGPNQVTFAGAILTYGALLWLALGAGTQVFTKGIGPAVFGTSQLTLDLSLGAAWVINLTVAEYVIRRPVNRWTHQPTEWATARVGS